MWTPFTRLFITVSIVQELTIFGQKIFHCYLPQTALCKCVPKYDTASNDGEVIKICNAVSESKFKVPPNDNFILEFVYYPRFWYKNHNTLAKGSTNIFRQTGYVDMPVVLGPRSGIWQALLWRPNYSTNSGLPLFTCLWI